MRGKLPIGTRIACFAILFGSIFLSATGWAAPEDVDGGGGGSGAVLLTAALAAMVCLGSPLFVIIGVLAAMCFMIYGDGYEVDPCLTLSPETICGFDIFPAKMTELSSKEVLLAIPFFVVSGAIMSAGDIANRLVGVAKSVVGFLPGGLAIATVGGCIFFAAISGSSPVTVIAIGSMMYPALIKAGYQDRFSIGLVTTAGSLGILIPPSIPMLVFAIVASGTMPLDVGELFMAGILPGLMIGGLLAIYSMFVAGKSEQHRQPFSLPDVGRSIVDGFWALSLPGLILGGIYTGLFTPTEAAAVSVVYALVVELFIHRKLTWHHLPKILADSATMMGTLLIIMAMAFSLNYFFVEEQVPDKAVEWIQSMDLTPVQFLLAVNVLLLIVGCLMDSISAILIIAPLLTPIAVQLGIDPVHLGIIFIVNLEIGYLTPPIGINLFVASAAFEKPLGQVIKSVVPFIGVMFVGLMVVTYVPSVSMGPVNVLLRGEEFYEPMPGADRSTHGGDGAETKILAPGEGDVRSMVDITKVTEQSQSLCYLAEDIVGDEDIAPAERRAKYRAGFEGEEITEKPLVEAADKALAAAGKPEAYEQLQKDIREMLRSDLWECAALETLLGPDGDKAGAKPEKDSDL
jgi:C4-dicarboxylate transporter DctM subunit